MGKSLETKIVERLKNRIRDEFGEELLQKAMQVLKLKEHVLRYAPKSGMDGAIDIADLFFQTRRSEIEDLQKQGPKGHREVKFIAPQRGSLQNIATYAAVLPLVLKARQAIFGHKQPLSYEEAVGWLVRENEDEPLEVVELTFRFRVSTKDRLKLLDAAIGGNTQETLKKLQAAQIPVDLPVPETNFRESSYRAVYDEASGKFYRMSSAKGAALAEWADFIAAMCGGFNEAVWLLLTGLWERLGVRVRHHAHPLNLDSMKETALDLSIKNRYARPFAEFHVRELETTPDELKRYYSEIRKRYGYGTQGQAMRYQTEVLALLAVETQVTEEIAFGDDGFYKRVLKRYHESAPMYGLEIDRKLDEEDVRKALKGAETAYRRMVSSNRSYEGYSPELFRKS